MIQSPGFSGSVAPSGPSLEPTVVGQFSA